MRSSKLHLIGSINVASSASAFELLTTPGERREPLKLLLVAGKTIPNF